MCFSPTGYVRCTQRNLSHIFSLAQTFTCEHVALAPLKETYCSCFPTNKICYSCPIPFLLSLFSLLTQKFLLSHQLALLFTALRFLILTSSHSAAGAATGRAAGLAPHTPPHSPSSLQVNYDGGGEIIDLHSVVDPL